MSIPNLQLNNIITQVSQDDNEGGISARREKNEPEPIDLGTPRYAYSGQGSNGSNSDSSTSSASAGGAKKGFCASIFCCFGGAEPAEVVEEEPGIPPLLPPIPNEIRNFKTLVLDLDETLVHSSFKPLSYADFIIPVEIDNHVHQVYVVKRPGVDRFLVEMGKIYELVVFTASLSKYADPVLDLLDKEHSVRWRLFREGCSYHKGNYVKDMERLGRDLNKSIIIDNSPASYLFHPENAIPITSWFDDENDTELTDLIPFLVELTKADDVRIPLKKYQKEYQERVYGHQN